MGLTSETKTVQTAYGEASIKVVECDSCGAEVNKESAARFAMDSETTNPRFNNAECVGYACEHCVDEGPISYPERIQERIKIIAGIGDSLFGIVLWPVASPLLIFEHDQGWQRGFALSSLGAWVWIIFVGVILTLILVG